MLIASDEKGESILMVYDSLVSQYSKEQNVCRKNGIEQKQNDNNRIRDYTAEKRI